MEFHEKLQELRKERDITQEELAEALYVSRTAVSKWESGRGYPNIESLKELADFYSVTIDDLLSCEKIITIAERENRNNLRRLTGLFIGIVDVLAIMLVILPLYPNPVDGYIYSVNLIGYTETTSFNRIVYWVLFLGMSLIGIIRMIHAMMQTDIGAKLLTLLSFAIHIVTAFFLVMAREPYGAAFTLLLLVIKAIILWYRRDRK